MIRSITKNKYYCLISLLLCCVIINSSANAVVAQTLNQQSVILQQQIDQLQNLLQVIPKPVALIPTIDLPNDLTPFQAKKARSVSHSIAWFMRQHWWVTGYIKQTNKFFSVFAQNIAKTGLNLIPGRYYFQQQWRIVVLDQEHVVFEHRVNHRKQTKQFEPKILIGKDHLR